MTALMLSDTAMVLLCQYIELEDYILAIENALSEQVTPWSHEWGTAEIAWSRTHNSPKNLWSVARRDLMEEIWYLWMFPDIPVVRHLSWHLVLTQDIISSIPTIWRPSRAPSSHEPKFSIAAYIKDSADIIPMIVDLYKQALAAQIKTTP